MGDLLLGLFTAWKYSKTYNMTLIVDWRWSTYFKDQRNLFSFLFGNCTIDGVKIIGDDSINDMEFMSPMFPPRYTNKILHAGKDDPYNYDPYDGEEEARKVAMTFVYNHIYTEPTVVIGEQLNVVPIPYQRNFSHKESMYRFYGELMKYLRPSLADHIQEVRDKLFGSLSPLGIHFRDGNKGEAFIDHKREIEFHKRNRLIQKVIGSQPQAVYFCTDTIEIEEKIKALRPDFIMFDRTLFPPGVEPHFGIDPKTQDVEKLTIDIFTEMVLFSFCSRILGVGVKQSCFSLFPSFLNNKPSFYLVT